MEEAEEKTQQLPSLSEFKTLSIELLSSSLFDEPSPKENTAETHLLSRLCLILDEYQEQSYLLDPHLEDLVKPLIVALRSFFSDPASTSLLASTRLHRLSRLIYTFTKVRGAKTILRLFPHEVTDLGILLSLLSNESTLGATTWETRYILLLWFSLVVMLPFKLATTSQEKTDGIEVIGMRYLGSASKERDAAVTLLARYYSRPDSSLNNFLSTCATSFSTTPLSPLLATGLLSALNQILRLSSPRMLLSHYSSLYRLLGVCDASEVRKGGALMGKYHMKLAGRLALLKLEGAGEREEMEVPDEVEVLVQELLEGTQDQATIVRWSSAKYLARISERIPSSFSSQIFEALLSPFDEPDQSLDEEKAESSWHGSCLAFAEFSRRKVVPDDAIERLIPCILRALLFDRKKGVQSLGSSVRDSAAYCLWSLARVLPPSKAAPHANQLAEHLVAVAVKLDFFTVGVRKRSFLHAASLVAEHCEYRNGLVRHLMSVTLTHYDPEIRTLGAGALMRIASLDAEVLVPPLVESQIALLATKDTSRLHGVILSLGALATAAEATSEPLRTELKLKIFLAICALPPASLNVYGSGSILLSAALAALESSATPEGLSDSTSWWGSVELASKSSVEEAHERAADAVRAISVVHDCRLDYSMQNQPHLNKVVDRLILFASTPAPAKKAPKSPPPIKPKGLASTIEGKRNGIDALNLLAMSSGNLEILGSSRIERVVDVVLAGFGDYTVDQRGDSLGQEVLDTAISSLLKQAVEKLDGLRERAGKTLEVLASLECLRWSGGRGLRGIDILEGIHERLSEWRTFNWAAERLFPLLAIPEYRSPLLEGAILGITPHSASSAFIDFAISLPLHAEEDESVYSLFDLLQQLVALGKANFTSNRLFIPVLNVFGMLVESGAFDEFEEESEIHLLRDILLLATRSVAQMKSWPRLAASIKIVASFLAYDHVGETAAKSVPVFLAHPLPALRQLTAEEIFTVVGDWDNASLQSLLSDVMWSQDGPEQAEAADQGPVLLGHVFGLIAYGVLLSTFYHYRYNNNDAWGRTSKVLKCAIWAVVLLNTAFCALGAHDIWFFGTLLTNNVYLCLTGTLPETVEPLFSGTVASIVQIVLAARACRVVPVGIWRWVYLAVVGSLIILAFLGTVATTIWSVAYHKDPYTNFMPISFGTTMELWMWFESATDLAISGTYIFVIRKRIKSGVNELTGSVLRMVINITLQSALYTTVFATTAALLCQVYVSKGQTNDNLYSYMFWIPLGPLYGLSLFTTLSTADRVQTTLGHQRELAEMRVSIPASYGRQTEALPEDQQNSMLFPNVSATSSRPRSVPSVREGVSLKEWEA
ncbi:tubulin-specific chaperone D [Pseudohyphozyma bogoriensis]|nr:tubulin-specific chaperone D [Pseudohyphozyma bogoriensis]